MKSTTLAQTFFSNSKNAHQRRNTQDLLSPPKQSQQSSRSPILKNKYLLNTNKTQESSKQASQKNNKNPLMQSSHLTASKSKIQSKENRSVVQSQQFIKEQLEKMKTNTSTISHKKSYSQNQLINRLKTTSRPFSHEKITQECRQQQLRQSQDVLQHHQELIQQQYQKLLQLNQQKQSNPQKNFKGPRSISTPDISIQVVQIKSLAGLSEAGRNCNGEIKTNQDSYLIKEKFAGKSTNFMFQVSDGHGTNGHFVSQMVKENLSKFIEQGILTCHLEIDRQMNRILQQAYDRTTKELMNSGIDITFSGSTNVNVLMLQNMIYCSNIGDSRAIIGRIDKKQIEVIEVSRDHKPDCKDEYIRIMESGGRVDSYTDDYGNPLGPARIWKRDENIPGLAMSRSFGDYVASQVGVISEPEIIKHALLPCDKFLILASDGIWEFLDNQQVSETVYSYYQKNDSKGACRRLIEMASKAWQEEDEVIDDITVIVVFFS